MQCKTKAKSSVVAQVEPIPSLTGAFAPDTLVQVPYFDSITTFRQVQLDVHRPGAAFFAAGIDAQLVICELAQANDVQRIICAGEVCELAAS